MLISVGLNCSIYTVVVIAELFGQVFNVTVDFLNLLEFLLWCNDTTGIGRYIPTDLDTYWNIQYSKGDDH
jgi:hypothetical protein